MTLAYIFPGQGSQYAGMGRELVESFAVARHVFEEADDALNFRLSRLCFEGSAEDLQLTEITQPAILSVSVAALRVLEAEGCRPPDFVAGHSLGEYSALVAAGALRFDAAVKLVHARGRYMQEAVPVGVGAMAAIVGLDLDQVQKACQEARGDQVCSPANINSVTQIVIDDHAEAIDRAVDLLKARGARRAIKLNVSAPFHCPLMQPAQDRLGRDLEKIEMVDLNVPLVTNVDAAIVRGSAEARDALRRQVAAPVRWLESIRLLLSQQVNTFVEVGPGRVLSGLVRQIDAAASCLNVEDLKSLKALRANFHKSDVQFA